MRLIDADKAYVDDIACYYGSSCYLEDVENWLSEQPVIEAEPVRHGRWIQDQQSKFEHRYNCSDCNYRLIDEPTNYCANCGAKMDAEEYEDLVNHTSLRIPRDQWEDAASYME